MWTVNRSITSFQLWCWRAVLDAADSRAVPPHQSCVFISELIWTEQQSTMIWRKSLFLCDLDKRIPMKFLRHNFTVPTVFSSKQQELQRLEAVELRFFARTFQRNLNRRSGKSAWKSWFLIYVLELWRSLTWFLAPLLNCPGNLLEITTIRMTMTMTLFEERSLPTF
jgi:hypothetical protein